MRRLAYPMWRGIIRPFGASSRTSPLVCARQARPEGAVISPRPPLWGFSDCQRSSNFVRSLSHSRTEKLSERLKSSKAIFLSTLRVRHGVTHRFVGVKGRRSGTNASVAAKSSKVILTAIRPRVPRVIIFKRSRETRCARRELKKKKK